MENINILIHKNTRQVDLSKSVIGNDGENLQENLVFAFDEFVDGTARLEIVKPDKTKSYLMLEKEEETYQIPIKSVITKTGRISMQLVITEGTDDEEIPIFKSNQFYMVCNTSINAETIQEEDYPTFIDRAETKLNAMDTALGEVNNLDITATKEDKTTTITITNKEGTQTSVNIYDGEDGVDGVDGQDGITPTIGDNGDWYIGETDTGKPSRGETGPVGPAGAIKMIIVAELPETGEEGTLYFVPKQDTETGDIYDEYMWVNNAWELIGEKQITIDLSDYVKNTDYATSSKGGVIKTNTDFGNSLTGAGQLRGTTKTYTEFTNGDERMFINKGTLENVITGKNLVSNTDYASSSVGGVIITDTALGTSMASNGKLQSAPITYADYQNRGNYTFISKGTLENVITGKGLVSNTDYASSETGGVLKVASSVATNMQTNGIMQAQTKTYELYTSGGNGMFIGKGTLENVISGKGLVSNTDYASSSVGGVIKTNGSTYGTGITNTGILNATVKSYTDYNNGNNNMFISKGTLDNVLTAVVGDISSAIDLLNGEVI